MKIKTLISNTEIVTTGLSIDSTIVVVIDVLRASSTICAALYYGAKEIIPCRTIEKAKEIYNNYPIGTVLLCGERNGVKPRGFDLGNSPAEFTKEIVENKSLIMTTTNCTNAISKLKNKKNIFMACFSNFTSVIELIRSKLDNKDIDLMFVCAGDNGNKSLEDTVCSGAYINSIVNRYDNCYLNEESQLALNTFSDVKNNLKEAFYNSEHGKLLRKLGFQMDIDLAMKYDLFPVVPFYKYGRIIPISPSFYKGDK
ncbi:MAG: 2-phosphosulfolactate phosphatase [Bacteroidetes bacterium]|nr:MAG: 2-phosphosulfolactate phosphatase [Bacteroidota bacterium]